MQRIVEEREGEGERDAGCATGDCDGGQSQSERQTRVMAEILILGRESLVRLRAKWDGGKGQSAGHESGCIT